MFVSFLQHGQYIRSMTYGLQVVATVQLWRKYNASLNWIDARLETGSAYHTGSWMILPSREAAKKLNLLAAQDQVLCSTAQWAAHKSLLSTWTLRSFNFLAALCFRAQPHLLP